MTKNRWIRLALTATLCLVVVAAVASASLRYLADRKAQRVVAIALHPVEVPTDTGRIGHGRYIFESRGCAECHGSDGAGRIFIRAKAMLVKSPDISGSATSVVRSYRSEDWERAIRHGVKPDGRPLLIMPSDDYNRLTDVDLGDLIAYVSRLPAATGTPARIQLPFIVRALYAVGVIRDAAEKIDHSLPPSKPVPVSASVEHGAYLINMCIGCHRATLTGGRIPGAPPEWPPAANLTPSENGAMRRYSTVDQFVRMLRTGRRPDGTAVSTVMPFQSLGRLDSTDAEALYMYIKSLPSSTRPTG